jgi:hypothetical protein
VVQGSQWVIKRERWMPMTGPKARRFTQRVYKIHAVRKELVAEDTDPKEGNFAWDILQTEGGLGDSNEDYLVPRAIWWRRFNFPPEKGQEHELSRAELKAALDRAKSQTDKPKDKSQKKKRGV